MLENHHVDMIYEVKELDSEEAFELFSWKAFRRNKLPDDYAKLAATVVHSAQRLPLALILLGSLLCGRSIDRWQIIFDDYRGVSHLEIQEILKLSYNALEDSVKEVFLDIACFFNGKEKSYVVKMLDSYHLNSEHGLEVLTEMSLISMDKNRIWMSDLLEEMGKEIFRQDSPEKPKNHYKLRFYKDVNDVLMENTETNSLKGIMKKTPKPDRDLFLTTVTSTDWAFLLVALFLEISSLVCDQLSSPSKPLFALSGMSLAIAALLSCICELIYNVIKEGLVLRRRGMFWRFHYPSSRSVFFGTLPNCYGVFGGIIQCMSSTIQYVYVVQHKQNPIKFSLMPAIFLICLGVLRINWNRRDVATEQKNRSSRDGDLRGSVANVSLQC